LSGLITLLIALIAFSCRDANELRQILINRSAWRRNRWRGHELPSGRVDQRGMIVTVFTDPENEGSTKQALEAMEFGNDALIK